MEEISFKNISVVFSNKDKNTIAVQNVSFDIHKGEIFGIVGTSGAGKSTLLRTINLLQHPTEGNVIVGGKDITALKGEELRHFRTNIGMIFQQFNLINTKTVYDNIAFIMKAVGKTKDEIRKRVPEVLELVGLTDKAQSYPAKLSGGEKQRVGIARTLANNPRIILCDEPTSALDLENTNAILRLLKEINEKLHITTVIISHEMQVIKKICNRVAVMQYGEVVELDEVFSVFTNPKHEYTCTLIQHTHDFDLPEQPLQGDRFKTIKILYRGDKACEAIISNTIKKFDITINILLAKVEYITNKPFGVVVVQLIGFPEKIEEAENYIKENTYRVLDLVD